MSLSLVVAVLLLSSKPASGISASTHSDARALLPAHPRLILTPERAAAVLALASSPDAFAREFVARTLAQAAWENFTVHHGMQQHLGAIVARPFVQAVYSLCVGAALTASPPSTPPLGDALPGGFRAAAVVLLLNAASASEWEPGGVISLTSGETLHGAGLAFDWLRDLLSPTQRVAVVEGIVDKGLAPVRAALSASPPPWAESFVSTRSNWNTVVLGGAVIACLAIEGEPGAPPWVADLRAAAVANLLAWSVPAWAPDGAWPEGPNYAGYTVRYLVPTIASLVTATGSDAGMRSVPGVLAAPRYLSAVVAPTLPLPSLYYYFDARVTPETVSSYLALAAWAGDAPAAARIKALLVALAPGSQANDTETTSMNAPVAVLYYTPLGAPGDDAALPLVTRFADVHVVTTRSSWAEEGATFIGFKGLNTTGNWAHTHLDQGSFVFYTHGQAFAQDLGSDSYSAPGYFSGSRFNLLRTNISGHNTLSFSGRDPQCDVLAMYAANCTPAPIVVFNASGVQHAGLGRAPAARASRAAAPLAVDVFAVLNLTEGLEHLRLPGLRRVQRGFIIGADRTQLVTVDEIEFASPVAATPFISDDAAPPVPPLWWTLHTVANVSLSSDATVATLSTFNVSVPVTVAFLPAASACAGAAFSTHALDLAPPLLPAPGVTVLRLTAPVPQACARIVVAVGVQPPGVGAGVRPLREWQEQGPLA